MYWSFLSTCTLLECTEASWVCLPNFTVLKLLEYIYLTLLYWNFLSTCTLLYWIFLNTFFYFTVLKLLEYLYLTSLYWTIWLHLIYFTVLNLLEYMYFTALYWSFLNTCTSTLMYSTLLRTCFSHHCNEAFWVHVPHVTDLKLLKKNYPLFHYWSFCSTCSFLQSIEAFWLHVLHFTLLKLFEYMLITSL